MRVSWRVFSHATSRSTQHSATTSTRTAKSQRRLFSTRPRLRDEKPQDKPPTNGSGGEKETPVDIPQPLWYHRLGSYTEVLGSINRLQKRRPYAVQLCATLTSYTFGDILAQEVGGEPYNPWRTLRMFTIGGIVAIPGYRWFLWLGNHFNYSSFWLSVGVKTAVQQAVFTPVFNTYFFGMQAILTGESPSGVIARIANTVPTSVWNSLKLWPAVTALSFAFVAPQYRFMASLPPAVCWQAYLSYLNRTDEKREDVDPGQAGLLFKNVPPPLPFESKSQKS